jgi:hypothetical protein
MHTNNILVPEHFGFRKGVSPEHAALKLTDSVLKSVNKKCMLEEFSVILQKLLIVQIMKFLGLNYILMEFKEQLQNGSDSN